MMGKSFDDHKSRRKCARHRSDPNRTSPTSEEKIRSYLSSLLTELRADTSVSEIDRFKYSYLEGEIYSKYLDSGLNSGEEERKTAAINKWRAAELRNAKTNVRLTCLDCEFTIRGRLVSSDQIIERASGFIRQVLGETPDLEVLYGTFTSGASTLMAREPGVVAKKFMDEAHVTAACRPWVEQIRSTCGGWLSISDDARGKPLDIDVVRGNVMFTVPKSSEIDRCAAKEPGLNMFCQKGVGEFIRSRLKSVSRLDLRDQTRNQRLARAGSIDGSLATIDLSSASDTISLALVNRLLPLDWFCLLNDLRSKECFVEGEWVELNMFSSMGNAFTFELETLIFWALTSACAYYAGVRGTISVYGDDIICPSAVAGLVARVFAFMGFKVNPKKSYWHGYFRESCGKHWYKGVDVTPFYVKQPIRSMTRVIHFGNRLRLWAGQSGRLDERFFHLWKFVSDMVPRTLRGGSDLQSIYQLASYEQPISRLVPRSKTISGVSSAGSYLHWLRAADCRLERDRVRVTVHNGLWRVDVEEPLVTSEVEIVLDLYAKRPAVAYSTGMELSLLFFEE
jgi:hypothetical protein